MIGGLAAIAKRHPKVTAGHQSADRPADRRAAFVKRGRSFKLA